MHAYACAMDSTKTIPFHLGIKLVQAHIYEIIRPARSNFNLPSHAIIPIDSGFLLLRFLLSLAESSNYSTSIIHRDHIFIVCCGGLLHGPRANRIFIGFTTNLCKRLFSPHLSILKEGILFLYLNN